MWRLNWREEFPLREGLWFLTREMHFISHWKRHECKLFPRQNLQGIKFLPTEDIPTAKARCQSFFLRKEFTHAYLRHGKSHAQGRVSKCLGLMTSSQIYNFNLLICQGRGGQKKSAQEPKSFMWARCGMSQNTPDYSPSNFEITPTRQKWEQSG